MISSPTPSSTTTTGPRRSQRGDDHARSLSALSPSSVCAHELAGARYRRGQPPPPRALAPVPLPRGRPAQRTRRAPRISPMPSAWLPTPYRAVAASTATTAMAPPWPGHPPAAAPTPARPGPPWTGEPAPAPPGPQPRCRPANRSPPRGRQIGHPQGPGHFAKSPLWFSVINPHSTQFKSI